MNTFKQTVRGAILGEAAAIAVISAFWVLLCAIFVHVPQNGGSGDEILRAYIYMLTQVPLSWTLEFFFPLLGALFGYASAVQPTTE